MTVYDIRIISLYQLMSTWLEDVFDHFSTTGPAGPPGAKGDKGDPGNAPECKSARD